jgi:AcrR family transcriptional regulator
VADVEFDLLTGGNPLGRKSSRELVLRAAVALVASSGIDNVSLSDVVRVAQVSRTTVYAHFGSFHDILAEIWVNAGSRWLGERLSSPVGVGSDARDIDVALTEILAVAKRVPEVAEVVVPDVQSAWSRGAAGGASAEVRTTWALAYNIGMPFTSAVVPSLMGLDWLGEFIMNLPDDAHMRLDLPPLEPTPLSDPWIVEPFDTSDTADRLMKASVDVVSRSGVTGASMTRISRVARLTAGAAHGHFPSVEDVIHRGFQRMMRAVVEMNLRTMGGEASTTLLTDQIAFVISSAHRADRDMWRRYRRELHLAARTNPSLLGILRPAIEGANSQIAEFHAARGFTELVVQSVVQVNQALVEGFSILHDVGVNVEAVDHRVATRWFLRTMVSS